MSTSTKRVILPGEITKILYLTTSRTVIIEVEIIVVTLTSEIYPDGENNTITCKIKCVKFCCVA